MKLVAVASLLLVAGRLGAQDIEVEASVRGIALPEGYYARVAEDPSFFELPNGWFRPIDRSARVDAARTPSARAASGGSRLDAVADPLSGDLRLLIVPVLFADTPPPGFEASHIERVLLSGPSEDGTLTEFYREVSGGRLSVTGTVTPWIRTSFPREEVVGESFGLGSDARTGSHLVEALGAVDELIDFREFDNDGPDGVPDSGDDDGIVDAVAFEFREVSASCGGPGIWPHRSGIAFWDRDRRPFESSDPGAGGGGIKVNGYIIQGATDCTGDALQTANTTAHELGHLLGLPDFYHPIDGRQPWQRRWVLGCWALMAGGAWGCGDGSSRGGSFGPVHFAPWSRARLGWIRFEQVVNAHYQEYVLDPVQTSERAIRIPLDPEGVESFVVEYRPQLGFDDALPASAVLIYHWDIDGALRPDRESGLPYHFSLEEADGDGALQRTHDNGGDRGVAGDGFAGDGSIASFTGGSTPSTAFNSGVPSTVTVHSIEIEDGRARIRISTVPSPAPVPGASFPPTGVLSPYEAGIRFGGGALPYRASLISGALPDGLEMSVVADRVVVTGTPTEKGDRALELQVSDALGSTGAASAVLSVGDFFVPIDRLAEPFVGGERTPLADLERDHLDEIGNGNGTYDIGDLRAHLQESGRLPG